MYSVSSHFVLSRYLIDIFRTIGTIHSGENIWLKIFRVNWKVQSNYTKSEQMESELILMFWFFFECLEK